MTGVPVRFALVGTFLLGAACGAVALLVPHPGASGLAHAEHPGCSNASLNGPYGGLQSPVHILSRPRQPDAPPLQTPINGSSVGVFTFDGAGNISRSGHTSNVGGMVGSLPGTGTCTVNADCTFSITFPPANGFPEEHYNGVLVAGGKRAYAIGTDSWLVNPITMERQ